MSIELAIDELAREVELAVGVPLGLQPGLPPVEIDGLLTAAGIALPSSVRRLYMHRNGVDTGDLDSVDEGTFAAMLLPEFHLMDFFQALPTSMSNVLDKPAGKFLGEYLDLPHQNFFEFLADAEGLRSFVVPAVAYDDAVVIFRHQWPEVQPPFVAFEGVEAMLNTFLEWYRADLFRLYEGRFFIANRDEMTRIHHSHNPTVIWPAWSGFYEGPEEPEFSEEMLAGPVASSGF